MEDKKLKDNKGKVNTISSAHKQADQDIHTDVDLSEKGPEDELDEGELARYESQDDGEMDVSGHDGEGI
jgi:hypothetical protein